MNDVRQLKLEVLDFFLQINFHALNNIKKLKNFNFYEKMS